MSEITIETDTSKSRKKRKNTVNKFVKNNLVVRCEWSGCTLSIAISELKFYHHVSSHLKNIKIDIGSDDEEFYVCGWAACKFNTKDSKEVTSHVKYHAYHAELRALGKFVSDKLKLPPCLSSSEFNILADEEDSQLVCLWEDCNENYLGIHEFLDHVRYHIKDIPYSSNNIRCQWSDCESTVRNKCKLMDHMKTHTKEHFIACPHCGHCFANKTKFADHCYTQIQEPHKHECTYCLRCFPTERLLKKHAAQHIHYFKCPMCSMTCNKPSLLCKHIRFKHISDKPFKCSLCNARCVTKSNLQSHLMVHISGSFSCPEENCEYQARSQVTMKRHIDTVHTPNQIESPYCCHLCDKKYKRGIQLTKHLGSKHNLKKPPGYSRFLYRLERDGYRRLQTVRLECMDVADIECVISDEEKLDVTQEINEDTQVITVSEAEEKEQVLSTGELFDVKSKENNIVQIISIERFSGDLGGM